MAGDIDKTQPVLVDVFDNTVVFRNEVAKKSSLKEKTKKLLHKASALGGERSKNNHGIQKRDRSNHRTQRCICWQ